MPRLHPLRRAVIAAVAGSAISALAADPDPQAKAVEAPKDAPATQVAQAQDVTPASGGSKEKIEVSAQREHYRGDVPVEELPQAVQTISGELIKEIGAVNLNDVLDLATGVARQNTFGGLWDGFAIRGFAGNPNLPSGYLVNGFNSGRGFGGVRDTSSIEKMEILKGPGSALFGRGEPGGTIAITTKKPQFETFGSGTFTWGSYNFLRGEGDFTTPLTDSIAVRINGAIEDADSFRDTVHTKREFLSPSVLAKVGKDTSIWYELEWSHQEIPFDRGVVASRTGELGIIPVSRFLGEPGDGPTVAKVTGHQLEMQHNLAKGWVLLVGGAYRTTDLNGIGENPELAVARQPYYVDGQTLSRQRRFTHYKSDDAIGRAEVSGSFMTGPFNNHILTGADYDDFKLLSVQSRYRPPVYNGQSLAVMNAVNIFDPVYGNQPAANNNVFDNTEVDRAYGVYLNDQIDITQQWKLRLGGRYDWYKQKIDDRLSVQQPPRQDVTQFSPQAGLTYKVNEDISVYTMGAKGFRPNTGFDVHGNAFEPEVTKSYEVGVKYDDGRISATGAVFKMKKTNVLTADPINQGFTIAIGSAESKGIELDLAAKLPWDTTVLLSYAYIDAYAASSVKDPDFARLVQAGDPLINIPKHNGNVLVLKDFPVAGHPLTLGAGVKYVSSRLGETGTTFTLPSYTLVRLLGTYHISPKWEVTGEVNNLTNKEWYPSSYAALWVAPGNPREYQLRTTYRF